MNIERATELTRQARDVIEDLHWSVYDEVTLDIVTGVEQEDAGRIAGASIALSGAGVLPGRGLPSKTLTEGLARARDSLAYFRIGAKRELVQGAQRALALVDAALAELDLGPNDPIVRKLASVMRPLDEA